MHRSQSTGLSCVWRDAGTLSEIGLHAKPTSIALLSIWNDMPQEFIDEAILSFRKRLRSCIATAGGHFEHSV